VKDAVFEKKLSPSKRKNEEKGETQSPNKKRKPNPMTEVPPTKIGSEKGL
jgi:hypothetical protein